MKTKDTQLTLAVLLESYFNQRLQVQRKVSRETVSTYRDALKLLVIFVSRKSCISPVQMKITDIDRDMVLAFLDYLEEDRGNCIRTRNARLAAIHSFFRYAAYQDPRAMAVAGRVLDIPLKRTTTPVLGYLTLEQEDALLGVVDLETKLGRRDYTLLLFMARTGARVSEAVGVNAADMRLKKTYQVLLRGKGGKERTVPMKQDLAQIMERLCLERQIALHEKAAVFVGINGNRLTRQGVTHIMRRTVEKARAQMADLADKNITPHTLRHTTAMNLLDSGVELNLIRSWLGHVNINTTHAYVEANLEMKRKALARSGVVAAKQSRYNPSDALLAFLESL